jgi:hypothetical protein
MLGAGTLSLGMHMSRVATWLSHRRLASYCRMVGMGLAAGIVAAGYVSSVYMGHHPISDFYLAVAWMLFNVFAVLALPVLVWFRHRCMQAAKREADS